MIRMSVGEEEERLRSSGIQFSRKLISIVFLKTEQAIYNSMIIFRHYLILKWKESFVYILNQLEES